MSLRRTSWSAFAVALALAGTSCGTIHFIRSPYTPWSVLVTYSLQEDLSIVSWNLGAPIDPQAVRFELLLDGRWQPLSFDAAPYPAGSFECAEGTCYRYTIPGRYQPPGDLLLLRSIHPLFGLLPAEPAAVQDRATTLAFAPHFQPGNGVISFDVDDFLAPLGTALRRHFDWRVEGSTGDCRNSTAGPDGTTDGDREEAAYRGALTDAGRYCATLRPRAKHGTPVAVWAVLLTHPILVSTKSLFTPPVEVAPVLYQVVYDLEIPNVDRCNATLATLDKTLALLGARWSVGHAFETIVLSEGAGTRCRQALDRRLSAAALAESIKAHVAAHVAEPHGTRVVVVYVNNLVLPLPPSLHEELVQLRDSLRQDPRTGAELWAIAPQEVLADLDWDRPIGWTRPDDKAFHDVIAAAAKAQLPFKTAVHEPDDLVPYVEQNLAATTGGLLKICSSTPAVQRVLDGQPVPDGRLTQPLGTDHELRYRVDLPPQLLVPNATYADTPVAVRYEACTRWCDHPFLVANGPWVDGWDADARCREST